MKRLILENETVNQSVFLKKELFSPEFDECAFDHCTFKHVEFQGATVFETVFSNCLLENVLIYWGLLSAQFKNCTFKHVLFAGTNLTETIFNHCTLHNVKFRLDNLGGGCRFKNVEFKNCTFSRTVSINSELCENTDLPADIIRKTISAKDIELVSGLLWYRKVVRSYSVLRG